ncbi:MAG: beta-propeller fold lactonase family protein, partial [Bacteroidota bacterium]
MKQLFLLLGISFILNNCTTESDTENDRFDLWVGTYTRTEGHVDGKADGIYALRVDGDSSAVETAAADIVNPSFVGLSPDGAVLYAVSEIGADVDSVGYVYAYKKTAGQLELLNRQPTFSFAPCHVSVHPDGDWLYVANYVGGMIARYPLLGSGSIGSASDTLRFVGSGPHPRQEASHPHSVTPSPDGRWVMVADLGTDQVHTFVADTSIWQ